MRGMLLSGLAGAGLRAGGRLAGRDRLTGAGLHAGAGLAGLARGRRILSGLMRGRGRRILAGLMRGRGILPGRRLRMVGLRLKAHGFFLLICKLMLYTFS